MATASRRWTEWDEPDVVPHIPSLDGRKEEIIATKAEAEEDMLLKIDNLGRLHAATGTASSSSDVVCHPPPIVEDWCACGQWFHPYEDTEGHHELTPFFMHMGIEWIWELSEAYPKVFTQHVCAVGLSMIQRFLQRPRFHHHFPRHLLQALIAVCLGLGVKIDQDNVQIMGQLHHEMFAEYTLRQLRDLEMMVCQALDFRLGWHTLLPLSIDEMVARVGNESCQPLAVRTRTKQYLVYFLDRSLQYAPEHTGCCKLTVFAACLCLSRFFVRRNRLVTSPVSVNPAPIAAHVLIRIHGASLFRSSSSSNSSSSPLTTPDCKSPMQDTVTTSLRPVPPWTAQRGHDLPSPPPLPPPPYTTPDTPSPCHKRQRVVDLHSTQWRTYAVL